MPRDITAYRSHGEGKFSESDFAAIGKNVIFEQGVIVFHAERIRLGGNIYVGHYTILKGYYSNDMTIGENTWIGQQCFIHSAGGVTIGRNVGIGPCVKIVSSYHDEEGTNVPILASKLSYAPVTVEDDCDLGVAALVLPGVRIGRGAQVGAGSVVTRDVPPYAIVAGVPARVLRYRSNAGATCGNSPT